MDASGARRGVRAADRRPRGLHPGDGRGARSAPLLSARSEDDVRQGVGHGLVCGRQHVAVGVEGDRDRRMPETLTLMTLTSCQPVAEASAALA
jgi:hypothetical protein